MARQSWLNCNRQRGVAGAGEKKIGCYTGGKEGRTAGDGWKIGGVVGQMCGRSRGKLLRKVPEKGERWVAQQAKGGTDGRGAEGERDRRETRGS